VVVEAAGYDVVLVETVGVGQSETAVADMTDMFLLLLQPGGGDELQGLKKGIMEMADLLVVNKADGDLKAAAKRTAADYGAALRLLRPASPNWTPEVLLASALEGTGIAEVWQAISRYRGKMTASGELKARRARQAKGWMWSEVTETLETALRTHKGVRAKVATLEAQVAKGETTPSQAAHALLSAFLGKDGGQP
jgi:LAO/AO transport system kinase